MTPPNGKWTVLVLATAGCIFWTGCGSRTAPVRGKVTFGGQPVTEGRIFFHPEEGRSAIGRLEPDGTYQLTTFKTGDGAAPGRYRVVVEATRTVGGAQPQSFDEELSGVSGEPGFVEWLVPKEYAQRETTPLSAEVRTGRNVIDFELQPPGAGG